MAGNYAKAIPRDNGNSPLQEFPTPFKAQARYYRDSAAVSSVITLTDNTTIVEVGTGGATGALLRWVPATETAGVNPFASVLTTNYDNFIPANSLRRFVVPKESQGVTSIVGINVQNGLYKRVAIMNVGAGSVLTAEH